MSRGRYDAAVSPLPAGALFDARGGEAALAAFAAAAGAPPATAANRFTATGDVRALRIGPRRVLIQAPLAREAGIAAALEAVAVGDEMADVALVSDMWSGFVVAGPGATDILAQGTPLPLSADAFPPGAATGTEMWAVAVILIREATDRFVVMVDRSLAGYLANWLAVANGAEGGPIPAGLKAPPASWKP